MSEKTLDKLIHALKSEAIEAADTEARKIMDGARSEAKEILKDAEAKGAQLIEEAKMEAQALVDKGESALQQAARDLQVSVQNELLQLLGKVLEQEVATAFTPELITSAVTKIVENVGKEATLSLPETMKESLANTIVKRLQNGEGIASIGRDAALLSGFSISRTDQGWSYHITPEEVAQLLREHLSPKWIALLKTPSKT